MKVKPNTFSDERWFRSINDELYKCVVNTQQEVVFRYNQKAPVPRTWALAFLRRQGEHVATRDPEAKSWMVLDKSRAGFHYARCATLDELPVIGGPETAKAES